MGKIAEGMGEGGGTEGADPEQHGGAGMRPGQGYAPNPGAGPGQPGSSGTVPSPPKPPPPPTIPKYKTPVMYAPKLYQEQGLTRNDFNTAHQHNMRFQQHF